MRNLYMIYGVMVLATLGMAEYRGWSLDLRQRSEECAPVRTRQSRLVPFGLCRLSPLHRRQVNGHPGWQRRKRQSSTRRSVSLIFAAAFLVIDKVTPYNLWKEIVQEHNTALAILLGAMSLGICIIIASAVH